MFIRVPSSSLARNPETGECLVWQRCHSCGEMMHISQIRCPECRCNIAWGSDPSKEPEVEKNETH